MLPTIAPFATGRTVHQVGELMARLVVSAVPVALSPALSVSFGGDGRGLLAVPSI